MCGTWPYLGQQPDRSASVVFEPGPRTLFHDANDARVALASAFDNAFDNVAGDILEGEGFEGRMLILFSREFNVHESFSIKVRKNWGQFLLLSIFEVFTFQGCVYKIS